MGCGSARGDKLGPMEVRPLVLALLVSGLAASLAACGPIAYVNEVTRRADDAVDSARAAEAEKLAPYWWTRATQYLHKARERAAHADFQGANRFGRLSSEAAGKAIEESEAAVKDPAKRTINPTRELAPAKE